MINESLWAAAISLVGVLSATAVQAQTANQTGASAAVNVADAGASAASTSNELEEVIVTARRREERQQDVPLAITSLSGDFLKENAVVGLSDLKGQVPALNIENFNSPVYTNIGIRGQRNNNVAPGQDPAVGYYFSEVSYSYPVGINEQLFDLQSLEVVEGPQGTLFGRNTTGGAVIVTPGKPTSTFNGSVTGGMTDFDHGTGYYTTDVINLPVNEVLQLRAAVNVVNHDGYVKNLITPQQLAAFDVNPYLGTSNANPDNENSKAFRISALLKPTASLDSYFLMQGSDYQDSGVAYSLTAFNTGGLAQGGIANFALGIIGANGQQVYQTRQSQQTSDFWTTDSGLNAYNRSYNLSGSNTTTWTPLDWLAVKNIVGYRHFALQQSIPLDGVPYQILDSLIVDDGYEYSEEFQLQGKTANDTFSWVAGYFYFDQHIDHPRATLAVPEFGGPVSHAEEVVDNTSNAEFAQGTVRIPGVQGLSFTGGIRNTSDDRKMTSTSWNSPGEVSCALTGVVNCEFAGDVTYNVITYNLSLDYKLDADTLLYVTRRKGYRAGGWNYVGGPTPDTFGPFAPEFVNDWEAGLKKDWHFGQAALRSNLAIYRSSLTDAQELLSPATNPNLFEVVNAASATINGGQLELTLIPTKGVELSGFLSLIDAKFDSFVFGGNNFTSNSFAQTPRTQYLLRGKYDLPLKETIGTISVSADYTHQSHLFYTADAQGSAWGPASSQGQDGYGILDLRLGWTSIMQSNFDAAFYVKNATATQYNTFGVMLYTSLGYNIASIGQPRIFGLEATYHF